VSIEESLSIILLLDKIQNPHHEGSQRTRKSRSFVLQSLSCEVLAEGPQSKDALCGEINVLIAPRVYEMNVEIQSGNYEDIVGVGGEGVRRTCLYDETP